MLGCLWNAGAVDMTNTTLPPPPAVDSSTVVYPLPFATTPVQSGDYPKLVAGFPDLKVSFNTVLDKASKLLVYGEALVALPYFNFDQGNMRHGALVGAGRAGLARAVALPDKQMLLAYTDTTLQRRAEAFVARNALFWAGGGSMQYSYRVGVPPGSVFDRADLWGSFQTIAVRSLVPSSMSQHSLISQVCPPNCFGVLSG